MRRWSLTAVVAAMGAFLVLQPPPFTWWGWAMVALAGAKVALALGHPRRVWWLPDLRVTVVLPFFAERTHLLERALLALTTQTRVPERVHIINDGSPDGHEAVERLLPVLRAAIPEVVYTRFEGNAGKRVALAKAMLHDGTDVFITTDSDTVLDPRAVEELLRPFGDPRVTAATGQVRALNRAENWLTRVTDLRYAVGVLHERAATSVFGSVLVCSGAVAAYRASAVRPHLEAFVRQRFLGRPVRIGDDRRLTNYALLSGRVYLQESAVAFTEVPPRLGGYLRQQLRWSRSFLQETVWVIQTFPLTHRVWWLCVAEFALWVLFTVAVLAALVLRPVGTGNALLHGFLIYVALMSWSRASRYLDRASVEQPMRQRITWFLLAPLVGFLHVFVSIPIRLWSVATLASMRWSGSRATATSGVPGVRAVRHTTSTSGRAVDGSAAPRVNTLPTLETLIDAWKGRPDMPAGLRTGETRDAAR